MWWRQVDGATRRQGCWPTARSPGPPANPAPPSTSTPSPGSRSTTLDGTLVDTWNTVDMPTDFHDFQMLENGNDHDRRLSGPTGDARSHRVRRSETERHAPRRGGPGGRPRWNGGLVVEHGGSHRPQRDARAVAARVRVRAAARAPGRSAGLRLGAPELHRADRGHGAAVVPSPRRRLPDQQGRRRDHLEARRHTDVEVADRRRRPRGEPVGRSALRPACSPMAR